jgi:hypothetical protein
VDSNVWLVASVWMGLALLASIISIRIGISVALIEIAVGILAGNLFGIHSAPWIDFLATFGSGLLTFLAGAEIDRADAPRTTILPARGTSLRDNRRRHRDDESAQLKSSGSSMTPSRRSTSHLPLLLRFCAGGT